ncbi:MAG: TonB-dependent receptor [Bacteroidales bacterium]|nr:TonB-dependent receptor [Bacteroidales bacterium]
MLKVCFKTIFIFLAHWIFAQNATIRGFVYDKSTGEPIGFANVYLKGTNYGSATDLNGYFAITQIKPGSYTIIVTFLGYDTIRENIVLQPNDFLNKKYFLEKSSKILKTVEITASRVRDSTKTQVSIEKITPIQITQIPTFGSPDLVQYLTNIPGIITTGDQGGQLYIRGGSTIQNKVLLDGMVIYNPFHSIGLFSVFETEIIRNVDVYTGGFGAQYGGRISSIMDITTRDGNKKRWSGLISGSPFGINTVFEGPIKKAKENSGSAITLLLAGKNSFLGETSPVVYRYVDTAGLPFNFRDIYGKINFQADNGSKLNLFGFQFLDEANYQGVAHFNWKAHGAGSNFLILTPGVPTTIEGIIAYSDYNITLTDPSQLPKSSKITGFNVGITVSYFLPHQSDIKAGVEMMGFSTDLQLYNAALRLIQQKENTTEFAIFGTYKKIIKKLVLESGLRLHTYPSLSEISVEPRMSLKYNISKLVAFKMAGGLYSQNLLSSISDRDIVNLFYGFISAPENLPREFEGKTIKTKLQKAQHVIGGFEMGPFWKFLTVNMEVYYKNFSQLITLNRSKIYDDNEYYYDKPDYLKKDFIIEKGYAAGVETSVKYQSDHFYAWMVYTLGYVKRRDELITYFPHYDRRHNVNLIATYTPGDIKKYEFSFRWNLGSGFPFTQSTGYYPNLIWNNGINTPINETDVELGILYGPYNNARLPFYHRLDVSIKRIFYLTEFVKLETQLSVTNAYNRKNIFYVDRITGDIVYQLPVLPSLYVALRF